MIPSELRRRLKRFICEHGKDSCEDEICLLSMAKDWVNDIKAQGYPEEELVLMAMAFQSYRARRLEAEEEMKPYQMGLAAMIKRNGGALRIPTKEIHRLDGSMTALMDPDGQSITYHLLGTVAADARS